jgi:branched-chain amino acid transport system permease protein
VTLMPVLLSVTVRFLDSVLGLRIAESTISNLELMVFGALIIFFLIVEPHGLARLWQIGKEKLRLWPFPH